MEQKWATSLKQLETVQHVASKTATSLKQLETVQHVASRTATSLKQLETVQHVALRTVWEQHQERRDQHQEHRREQHWVVEETAQHRMENSKKNIIENRIELSWRNSSATPREQHQEHREASSRSIELSWRKHELRSDFWSYRQTYARQDWLWLRSWNSRGNIKPLKFLKIPNLLLLQKGMSPITNHISSADVKESPNTIYESWNFHRNGRFLPGFLAPNLALNFMSSDAETSLTLIRWRFIKTRPFQGRKFMKLIKLLFLNVVAVPHTPFRCWGHPDWR